MEPEFLDHVIVTNRDTVRALHRAGYSLDDTYPFEEAAILAQKIKNKQLSCLYPRPTSANAACMIIEFDQEFEIRAGSNIKVTANGEPTVTVKQGAATILSSSNVGDLNAVKRSTTQLQLSRGEGLKPILVQFESAEKLEEVCRCLGVE
uniref:Pyr_redox_2 domain-containing protein n=1 Tax=Panagrellus redivivus TaxID=6233 RepID=A0A7E4VXW4_PANRE